MMLYTIGHKENYLKAYAEHQAEGLPLLKLGKTDDFEGKPYGGGFVVQTLEEARRAIGEIFTSSPPGKFAVFGLDADWEHDTYPAPDGWWHLLLQDAPIILLEEPPHTDRPA